MEPRLRPRNSPSIRWSPIVLLLLAALAFALAGCNSAPAQTAPGPQAAAVAAAVAPPVVRNVSLTRSYPAEVEAIERVELRPQVTGALEAVQFQEGARVSRGQVLFRIDPRPFRAQLAEAEAALAQAETEARTAMREADRAARLLERHAIPAEETERRQAAVEAGAARVAAARAAVERARLQLGYTEVKAPIAGRIGRTETTRGNLVGPETRLAVLVATDPVYVRFDVDETTLAKRAETPGRGWRVLFALSGSTRSRPAEIAFVDNEIGRGTGTLRVRARLKNVDGTVIPGMYGTATLTFGEQADALLVREEAIGADQGQRFVLALGADNSVQYRPVTLGARADGLRVVTSGLKPEDRIVVDGLYRLRPGAIVAPRNVPMQTAASEAGASRQSQES